jgi:predicted deacylase
MTLHPYRPPGAEERALRQRIDSSLSRALFDREYEKLLLADPTIVLDHHGCTPQQFLELRGIHAHDIREFASQAEALFWPAADGPARDARRVLVAAAF